jgi:cell fate (sporulation/competence/biofilm development) regulator YlbF (YheA/YmcA/DUF963 family)
MNVYDKAYELARALKDSPEAKEWAEANAALAGDPDAKRMLDDFRKRQMDAERAMLEGKELPQEEKDKLNKLYEVLLLHGGIRRVLDAERRLAQLWADTQKIVGEAWRELFEAAQRPES